MLYFFHGDKCPHCIEMMPLVDKMIGEGIAIEKLETWNNKENETKRQEYDKDLCGGVPFFYNTDNKEFICGSTSEENLRKWAAGS